MGKNKASAEQLGDGKWLNGNRRWVISMVVGGIALVGMTAGAVSKHDAALEKINVNTTSVSNCHKGIEEMKADVREIRSEQVEIKMTLVEIKTLLDK